MSWFSVIEYPSLAIPFGSNAPTVIILDEDEGIPTVEIPGPSLPAEVTTNKFLCFELNHQ